MIVLDEVEAGKIVTKESTKLTFGYNDIDNTQVLNLEVYDGNKQLKKISKSFETN